MEKYKHLVQNIRRAWGAASGWWQLVLNGLRRAYDGYSLDPLYPTIEKDQHRKYVATMNAALKDAKVNSVALTGDYGSGKSSVLEWFVEDKSKRIVRISFATLGANIEKYITGDSEESKHKRLNTLSNLIQKEIIKQILFNDKPSRLVDSRYKRASKTSALSVLLSALLISSIISIILYLNGFNITVLEIAMHNGGIAIYLWTTLVVCIWLTTAVVMFRVGSHIKIDQITGGPISLKLTGENNYLDEYLDEIIYYFEATKRDIVIIEDIDRFNTLYIFENLRQLNNILNNARQVKQHVRFIYAVKDSIFISNTFDDDQPDSKKKNSEEQSEDVPAEQLTIEQQRDQHKNRITNRTKFFDVIIPIVPFITNATSRNYIEGQLGDGYKVSRNLIEIVSKHLIDMRLIKNICNEFFIFHDKVIKESNIEALNDDGLFALIVYKNIHLDDFEKIKSGDSLLNGIDELRREFIKERLRTIVSRLDYLSRQLRKLSSVEDRGKKYGAKLIEYVKETAGQIGGLQISSFSYEGKRYSEDEILSAEFWRTVCKSDPSAEFAVAYNYNYRSPEKQILTRDFIARKIVTEDDLDIESWEDKDAGQIRKEIAELKVEQKRINHFSISDLIKQWRYRGFKKDVEDRLNDSNLINPKLVVDLYENGYIDVYYSLYTSIYHSQGMSPKALNYAIQFIHKGEQDMFYTFNGSRDIEKMLADNGSYIGEKSMYNIQIVDYLLADGSDDDLQKVMVNLGNIRDNALEFIDEYLKSGSDKSAFIEGITLYWPDVFTYLVDSHSLGNKDRLELLSAALASANDAEDYLFNDSLVNFIEKEAKNIKVLSSAIKTNEIKSVMAVLGAMNIKFPKIENLNARVRQGVIESSLYAINRDNLIHLANKKSLSLETFYEKKNVYSYILNNLNSYLLCLKGKDFALDGKDGYIDILNDIADYNKEKLKEVISRSGARVKIADLELLKNVAWPQVVATGVMENKLTNALKYYEYGYSEGETVDQLLGDYLNEKGTLYLDHPYEEFDEAKLKVFILAVLNSEHITNEVKSQIAADCYTKTYISASDVTPHEGTLFGLLRKKNVINDNAETINALSTLTWKTRKQYFEHTQKLDEYIDEVDFSAEDVIGIAEDAGLEAMKDYLLNNIHEHSEHLSALGAHNLLMRAYSTGVSLDAIALRALFEKDNDIKEEVAIKLINRLSSGDISKETIIQVLVALGGEYARMKMSGIFARRPLLDDTSYNRILLSTLVDAGIVNRYRKLDNGKLQVDRKSG